MVAGVGLRVALGSPDLTHKRFVPNAMSQIPSDKRNRTNTLYKTNSRMIDLDGSWWDEPPLIGPT